MVSAAELAEAVRRTTADTPYTVTDETADGFTVHLDVADARWWTLLRRKSLSTSFEHVVRVDAAAGTYTVTDRARTVAWEAGADVSGGVPRPVLRGSAGFGQGTFLHRSVRKEYAIGDDGRPDAVVDYSFDAAEGARYVDGAAERLGLRKRVNTTARVGIVVAVVGMLGALAAVVALLLLR